jgi:osmoprotectant transport system ATP-binding protein
VIALTSVTKRFGERVAVDGVSLELAGGATHVVLGSSGCGKSTILRLILGLLAPDAGEIVVDGTPVSPATRASMLKRMGYVVQHGGLYPHLTAFQNAALAAAPHRWPGARVRDRVAVLADMMGFDDEILRLFPGELSGGQRQRASLMRALMLDPPILLLDEPLGALDPLVRADLQSQLGRLFRDLGKTVLLVTHDIREAMILGQTVTLMTAGRVVQHGTFDDLRTRPADPFVTAFLEAQALPAFSGKGTEP